jgi:hypothetical protein
LFGGSGEQSSTSVAKAKLFSQKSGYETVTKELKKVTAFIYLVPLIIYFLLI